MPIAVPIFIGAAASGLTAAVGTAIAGTLFSATVGSAVATAIGTAALSGASTLIQGGSASDALKSAALAGTTSFVGANVGNTVGSFVAEQTGNTIASNIAQSMASASAQAAIRGGDIGQAALSAGLGAGLNIGVSEGMKAIGADGESVPPPVRNAATAALRAAFAGKDIPEAVAGSFGSFLVNKVGGALFNEVGSVFSGLQDNFSQQAEKVDQYNALVDDLKTWDEGYQSRVAEIDDLQQKYIAESGGAKERERVAAAMASETYRSFGRNLERREEWLEGAKRNPYEQSLVSAAKEANDYISRYNEVWSQSEPTLNQLKTEVETLQKQGDELAERYTTLDKTLNDQVTQYAKEFKADYDAQPAEAPVEPAVEPAPQEPVEPAVAPAEPAPVEPEPVAPEAPVEPVEPAPLEAPEEALPEAPEEAPQALPEAVEAPEATQPPPEAVEAPVEAPEAAPAPSEPESPVDDWRTGAGPGWLGEEPAEEAPVEEAPAEEMPAEEAPADWVSGEELPPGEPLPMYPGDQDDRDMLPREEWYPGDQDDRDMLPQGGGFSMPRLQLPAPRPSGTRQQAQAVPPPSQTSWQDLFDFFEPLTKPGPGYNPQAMPAPMSALSMLRNEPRRQPVAAPAQGGLGAVSGAPEMPVKSGIREPMPSALSQTMYAASPIQGFSQMPQVAPLEVPFERPPAMPGGLSAMSPQRFDVSQLRQEPQYAPPQATPQSFGPLGGISGLTAMLRGR